MGRGSGSRVITVGESSQQRQGGGDGAVVEVPVASSGSPSQCTSPSGSAVDVYFRYISCQTRVIALPGPPDPWAAIAKIGSTAWAEGRVLGSLHSRGTPGGTKLSFIFSPE
ncbi:hypothetical protein Taro_006059 [Colocasia esculenta]|uniref:Uncharacterized protein n=1 Tax=Colocasia esculenta TaxID=4460 RepID=A0A843TRG3_COLES|nr:hypothetical protein [Colocasia esculenta]